MKKQGICRVNTCERSLYRLTGYCRPHARAMQLYGDPLKAKQHQWHGLSLRERFLKYVNKTDMCWRWVGSVDSRGYGRLNIDNTPELAHRISWRLFCGEIPEHQHVLHKCHHPYCVNPEHLYVGDHQDNMNDKMDAGRHRYGVHHGMAHGMAKLTDDDVRMIRASAEQGVRLAEQYGVSRTTIYDIRNRKIWQHID
jgi:HNH endonuclease